MIVSVVTREVSDDANAVAVPSGQVWLRIARKGRVLAFHASPDGEQWAMVRVFALGAADAPTWIGFLAQSPTGPGCSVRFSATSFRPFAPQSIRDGA